MSANQSNLTIDECVKFIRRIHLRYNINPSQYKKDFPNVCNLLVNVDKTSVDYLERLIIKRQWGSVVDHIKFDYNYLVKHYPTLLRNYFDTFEKIINKFSIDQFFQAYIDSNAKKESFESYYKRYPMNLTELVSTHPEITPDTVLKYKNIIDFRSLLDMYNKVQECKKNNARNIYAYSYGYCSISGSSSYARTNDSIFVYTIKNIPEIDKWSQNDLVNLFKNMIKDNSHAKGDLNSLITLIDDFEDFYKLVASNRLFDKVSDPVMIFKIIKKYNNARSSYFNILIRILGLCSPDLLSSEMIIASLAITHETDLGVFEFQQILNHRFFKNQTIKLEIKYLFDTQNHYVNPNFLKFFYQNYKNVSFQIINPNKGKFHDGNIGIFTPNQYLDMAFDIGFNINPTFVSDLSKLSRKHLLDLFKLFNDLYTSDSNRNSNKDYYKVFLTEITKNTPTLFLIKLIEDDLLKYCDSTDRDGTINSLPPEIVLYLVLSGKHLQTYSYPKLKNMTGVLIDYDGNYDQLNKLDPKYHQSVRDYVKNNKLRIKLKNILNKYDLYYYV